MFAGKSVSGFALLCLQTLSVYAADNTFYIGASAGYNDLGVTSPQIDTATLASELAQSDPSIIGQPEITFDTAVDDRDMFWKIYGGYNYNQYFGVEAGYTDFGKATINSHSSISTTTAGIPFLPPPFNAPDTNNSENNSDTKITIDGIQLAGMGKYPLTDKFNLFGKFGGIRREISIKTVNTARFSGGGIVGSSGIVQLSPTIISPIPRDELTRLLDPTFNQPINGISNDFPAFDPTIDTESDTTSIWSDIGIDILFGLGTEYVITENIKIRGEWEHYHHIGNGSNNINAFSIGINYLFGM